MAMFFPVSSSQVPDVAPIERAPVERLIRQTSDPESVRDTRERRKPVGNGPDDDQFAMMFRLLLSFGKTEPAVQTPQTSLNSTATKSTTGVDGGASLTTGNTAAAAGDIATAASSASSPAANAATASSSQQVDAAILHRMDSAAGRQAGILADIQSTDAAGLNAKVATTIQNSTPLSGGSKPGLPNQPSSTATASVSPDADTIGFGRKVLPSTVQPVAAGPAPVELDPEPTSLSDEVAAALERIGRPAADMSHGAAVPLLAATASPVKAIIPLAKRELGFATNPIPSDPNADASKGISAKAALPESDPPAKKPVAHGEPGDSLPNRADPEQNASVLLAQSPVVFSAPELSATISGELRQPLTHQVTQALIDRLERGDIRETESLTVQLDPPELGEMVIELSKTRDGLAVKVTAREAVTMDMLLARGSEIESQLRGKELDLKSLEFLPPNMGGESGFERRQNHSARQADNTQALRRSARRSNGESGTVASGRPLAAESRQALSFRA